MSLWSLKRLTIRPFMIVLAEKTDRSPRITYHANRLEILGRSYMNNSVDFYKDIIAKLESLVSKSIDVRIALDYFNTSSSKCLLELFKMLETKSTFGTKVNIRWEYSPKYYDMLEAGEDYRDILEGVNFEIVEISEYNV